MPRIVIVGTTGTGKSTLAAHVASRLHIPHIDLDDLFWEPGWQGRPDDIFIPAVAKAAAGENWAISGNYTRAQGEIFPRAQTVVWLDYGFFRTLWQLLRRSLRRASSGEMICNGNHETLAKLFSADSIILWFFKTWAKNRRKYGDMFAHPGLYPHHTYIRLRHPRQTEIWLQTLSKGSLS